MIIKTRYQFEYRDLPSYVIIIILLYLYIFNPPFSFLPVGPIKFIYVICLFYFISKKKFQSFYNLFKVEIVLSLIILLFTYFRGIVLGDAVVYMRNNFSFFFESLFLPYFLVVYYKSKLKDGDMLDTIIIVSFIAALITVVLIAFPSISNFVNNSLLSTNNVTILEDEMSSFRRFGLAEGLTYGYGIVQGIVLAICLYLVEKDKKYYLFIPFLFLSILFNARSGFVPIILMFLYLMIVKRRVKLLLSILVIVLLGFILLNYTSIFDSKKDTLMWGVDFIQQIVGIFDGSATGTNNYLKAFLSYMFIVPDTTNGIILGDGINVFNNPNLLIHTDVGYSQQLNFGGLVYIILLFTLISYMFKRVRFEKWYSFLFLLTIITMNLKGYFLWSNCASKLLFLVYAYLIISKYETKEQI